jgi:3'-phosphoadenosine 5'-phosphosulfate sulfotransferase (PAPS reductase)/FAD synthetase
MIAIVSTSGGKDSTATLILAVQRLQHDQIFPVFADTGNENQITYDYLDYLESKLSLRITRLKKDFTVEWWDRRDYVRDNWVEKMVKGRKATDKSPEILPVPRAEAEEITARVLSVLEKGPTGNPFLDLCMIKGRFPSRMAQFCTQELKTKLLRDYGYEMARIHQGVESWQGVRADESPQRAKLLERESEAGLFDIYRPILKWNVAQVFQIHRNHGIEPNPLYKLGMGRVGCMPCINAKKDELLSISQRFPDHISRIEEWEKIVSVASKRGQATFFKHSEIAFDSSLRPTIRNDVEWSQTSHGGKTIDLTRIIEPEPCVSSYGLCETYQQPQGESNQD